MVDKPLTRIELLSMIERGTDIPFPDNSGREINRLIWDDRIWFCRKTRKFYLNPSGLRMLFNLAARSDKSE